MSFSDSIKRHQFISANTPLRRQMSLSFESDHSLFGAGRSAGSLSLFILISSTDKTTFIDISSQLTRIDDGDDGAQLNGIIVNSAAVIRCNYKDESIKCLM